MQTRIVQLSRMNDRLRDAIRAYLQSVMDELEVDATTLARRAGLHPSTLTRFMNSPTHKNVPTTRTLQKVSDATGIKFPLTTEQTAPSNGLTKKMPKGASPIPEVYGVRDLQILGRAKGGAMGGIVNLSENLGYTDRPWFLMGRADGYALQVFDESMSPVFESGHTIYVDPSRPCSPNDDVVIVFDNWDALVKRLVRRAGDKVVVKQFNPDREIEFPASEIRRIDLVVGSARIRI